MDFDAVLALLNEGKVDDVKNVLSAFKPQFEKTVGDLKAYEGKFNEAVSTRDKAKGKLKEISGVFGVDSEELTTDKLKELIKTAKGDDASKAEIANLQKMLSDKEAEYGDKLNQSEARFRDKLIEVEIAKLGAGNDVVNDKALKLVIESLKEGATIDNGDIIYRDANGATIRSGSGQPLSIAEKMAQFKSDTSNSFLFKATSNGGGGSGNSNGGGAKTMIRSDFDKLNSSDRMNFVKGGGKITE